MIYISSLAFLLWYKHSYETGLQVNERIPNNLVNYNERELYIVFAFENSKMFENLNKISNL